MVRVVVVTMIPNGGATTRALQKLGFNPYLLGDILTLTGGAHMTRWASWITGGMRLDQRLFDKHDSVAGPPLAKHILKEIHRLPAFTKVILVEEADKMRWQDEMGHRILPALDRLDEYVPKSRHIRASKTIMDNMFVLPGNKKVFADFKKRMEEERVMAEKEMMETEEAVDDKTAAAEAAVEGQKQQEQEQKSESASDNTVTEAEAPVQQSTSKMSLAGTTSKISTMSIASEEAAKKATARGEEVESEPIAAGTPGYELVEALEQFEGNIKGTVPAERLLVFREEDGWEPLIEFLGMDPEDIPKGEEFPEFEDGIEEFEALTDRLVAGYRKQLKAGRVLMVLCGLALIPWLQWLPTTIMETWEDYKRINVTKVNRTVERMENAREEAVKKRDEMAVELGKKEN